MPFGTSGNIIEILIRGEDEFSGVFQNLKKQIAEFAKANATLLAVGSAATATAGALFGIAKVAADYGDKINDARQRTGLMAQDLAALKYAAEQSGTSFEGVTTGLKQFAKAAYEASTGGKEQAEAFQMLGIQVKDATGHIRPIKDLLNDVASRFAFMPDGIEKTALAMKLFGKSGADLIPLLNEGSTGLAKLTAEAKKFGLVIDDEAAKAADH